MGPWACIHALLACLDHTLASAATQLASLCVVRGFDGAYITSFLRANVEKVHPVSERISTVTSCSRSATARRFTNVERLPLQYNRPDRATPERRSQPLGLPRLA